MNVAIYLRKSREEENETREETLARHERILLDYCNKNDLIIKEISNKKNIILFIDETHLLVNKSGGIDFANQLIILADKKEIPINELIDISGKIFDSMYENNIK